MSLWTSVRNFVTKPVTRPFTGLVKTVVGGINRVGILKTGRKQQRVPMNE